MNVTIQTVMQTEIVAALQHVPVHGQLSVKEYFDSFMVLLKNFQLEVEWNIMQQNSYSFSVEYLNVLIQEFKDMHKLFDGSFDIEFYPDLYYDIGNRKMTGRKTYFNVRRYTILSTISMLKARKKIIRTKLRYKLPLIEGKEISLSKYVLKEKSLNKYIFFCNLIYSSDILDKRLGEKMQLYEYLNFCCELVGEYQIDIHRKLTDIKRWDNPVKFINEVMDKSEKKQFVK